MVEMEREAGQDTEHVQKIEKQPDIQAESAEETKPVAAFESIYDRLPDISIKAVDRFIIICVIALIAVVAIGILRARHII